MPKRAIAAAPDDAATAFALAQSYDVMGAWVSAFDFCERAVELNRGNLEYREYRLALADRYYDNDMASCRGGHCFPAS